MWKARPSHRNNNNNNPLKSAEWESEGQEESWKVGTDAATNSPFSAAPLLSVTNDVWVYPTRLSLQRTCRHLLGQTGKKPKGRRRAGGVEMKWWCGGAMMIKKKKKKQQQQYGVGSGCGAGNTPLVGLARRRRTKTRRLVAERHVQAEGSSEDDGGSTLLSPFFQKGNKSNKRRRQQKL